MSKECRKSGWFDFTSYIFGRYSTHHDVHYALEFDTSFEPKWPRVSFPAPDPKVKVYFII